VQKFINVGGAILELHSRDGWPLGRRRKHLTRQVLRGPSDTSFSICGEFSTITYVNPTCRCSGVHMALGPSLACTPRPLPPPVCVLGVDNYARLEKQSCWGLCCSVFCEICDKVLRLSSPVWMTFTHLAAARCFPAPAARCFFLVFS
jgi:hypothetical protein